MIGKQGIIIFDEEGFARVCSAMLVAEGYIVETLSTADKLPSALEGGNLELIITSYPYSASVFEDIKRKGIPTIILADNINKELIEILNAFDNSYCMIKPLDYYRFRHLVRQVMVGDLRHEGGYAIV
ncbi:MAG: DNA-binding response regulator [Nitrospirae bacterium]|nr:DNA-binding response regulator [Nitrospirota bacterium]